MIRLVSFLVMVTLAVLPACSSDSGDPSSLSGDVGSDSSEPPDATGGGPDGLVPEPDGGGVTDDGGPTTDGGQPDPEPEVTSCGTELQPSPDGVCTVTPGSDELLIEGTLVLPTGLLEGGQVLLSSQGLISCVGCDCGAEPGAAAATRVTCADGIVSPGLINAHDHISFTEMKPALHGDERYDHRHEWRKGKNGKTKLSAFSNNHDLGASWGEIRQVMAGTTSLFGSGGDAGFLRNLDKPHLLEGVTHPAADYSTFPLGDSDGTLASSGCGSYSFDNPDYAADAVAYVPHVAEGINAEARNEFVCMTGEGEGAEDLFFDTAAYIHGIGTRTEDIGLMAGDGVALVWSPRSNTDLYGMTADVPIYDRLGVLVALGTDWTATGSVHMLRELQCAASWNDDYWDGHFDDADLVAMATSAAAEVLGFHDLIGSLVQGKQGDVTIWDGSQRGGYQAILEAEPTDVVLVLRGGTPLYGDASVTEGLTADGDCETMDVCGRSKLICAQREIGTTVVQLESEMDGYTYGLHFCGTPDDEPSCVPLRPDEYDGVATGDDADGDGLSGVDDNCDAVFNPPRPVDGFIQPDVDGDGAGDACDPCPFDPDTTACSSVDPNDVDGDGLLNALDNCSGVPNPEQEDADDDGAGDACDDCPTFWNPGGSGCPATIYSVKTGATSVGSGVALLDVIVTAVTSNAFFITTDPDSDAYDGAEYASVFVYFPDQVLPAVGDRLNVDGTVNDFYGQTQVAASWVEVLSSDNLVPAPILVEPGQIVIGGEWAEALEASLVRVEGVTVTTVSPAGDPAEVVEGEFEVTGGLPIDDLMYLLEPEPIEGQFFTAITGSLRYGWNRNKLNPRSSDDVVYGDPELVSFGPEQTFIWEGVTGVTSPPLVVGLNGPALEDTFIAITSPSPEFLDVVGGGVTIPEGASSAQVELEAKTGGSDVVLTAAYDGAQLARTVTVLSAADVPTPEALAPPEIIMPVDTVMSLTLTLDLPAGVDGQVVELAVSGDLVTAPDSVLVPSGEFETSFEITSGASNGSATLTASVGPVSVSATIEVTDLLTTGLVLSEVLYDVTGGDSGYEWVKLYNGSPTEIDLDGWAIGYGGTDYTWGTFQLEGAIGPWACVVVGGPNSEAKNGNPDIYFAADFQDDIQNSGNQADGVALFEMTAAAITATTPPVDAVVYGDEGNGNNLMGPGGDVPAEPHVGESGSGNSLLRVDQVTWVVAQDPTPGECVILQAP